MKRSFAKSAIRFVAIAVLTTIAAGISHEATAGGKSGPGRSGGGRARQSMLSGVRRGGGTGVKSFIGNTARRVTQTKTPRTIQTQGRQVITKKAQQLGFSKTQVLANKNHARQWLTGKVNTHTKSKALDFVRNHGKKFVKTQVRQHGIVNATNLVGHHNHHGRHLIQRHDWCHRRPRACHWWYDICQPIRHCQPHHCVTYSGRYVTCDTTLANGHVIEDARWYLGLQGIVLPGKGIGIESVDEGSPAANAGLQAGMVITQANGIELADEAAMQAAIAQSGGVLNLIVLDKIDGQPLEGTVLMQRVVSTTF